MSSTEGATATKDGDTYKITGTASGVSEANPAEQITKPFEINVTCPGRALILQKFDFPAG